VGLDPALDREHLVLYRGKYNFILLNLYPYTTGHMLVTPYAHAADLDQVSPETLVEMMALAQRLQTALRESYNPEGYNLGMNLGKCAGAGVADHLHLHLLPRWTGDSNFMTVVGETRVQPEDLLATYDKLTAFFPPNPKTIS
jgi:ATP adenylyltransferase